MDYEHNSVVSRVGPVTSFVYSFESTSGAHPTSGCHLYSEYRGDPADSTLGLTGTRRALITDLFADDAVFEVLVHAWPVRDALGDKWPTNLGELLEQLKPTCVVAWDELPNAFAVMAVVQEGHAAVVRFGLGYGCEGARGNNTEFDVLIRTSDDKESWFRAAAEEKTLGLADTCGGTHEWSCCLRWWR